MKKNIFYLSLFFMSLHVSHASIPKGKSTPATNSFSHKKTVAERNNYKHQKKRYFKKLKKKDFIARLMIILIGIVILIIAKIIWNYNKEFSTTFDYFLEEDGEKERKMTHNIYEWGKQNRSQNSLLKSNLMELLFEIKDLREDFKEIGRNSREFLSPQDKMEIQVEEMKEIKIFIETEENISIRNVIEEERESLSLERKMQVQMKELEGIKEIKYFIETEEDTSIRDEIEEKTRESLSLKGKMQVQKKKLEEERKINNYIEEIITICDENLASYSLIRKQLTLLESLKEGSKELKEKLNNLDNF